MPIAAEIHLQELEIERKLELPAKVYEALREKFEYCLVCGEPHNLEAHHIIFRSHGGEATLENLVLVCSDCHSRFHGLVVKGKQPMLIRRISGALEVRKVDTGEVSIIGDETPHRPTEEMGKEAHSLHSEIIQLRDAVETGCWYLGVRLKKMKDSASYKSLGFETFNEYIASPDVGIGHSTVYKFIAIVGHAERLELEPSSVEDIDKDRLQIVLPGATKEDVDDRLADARTLSRSDLRGIYSGRDAKETAQVQHEHKCQHCGKTNHYEGV